MPYPIAMIPYMNMAPYRAAGVPTGCVFVEETPRDSVARLLAGDTLAACAPVGALAELLPVVDTLGPFGIAATGATESVLCFSRQPFAELNDATRLYLTGDSASSVRLLYLLLGGQAGFDHLPRQVEDEADADAVLLIGDAAIHAATVGAWAHVTDLAAEWYRQQQLPFVFARWVIRKDAPAAARSALTAWLADYVANEVAYTASAIVDLTQLGDVPEEFLHRYFSQVRRCLTAEDFRGQELFLAKIKQHGRAPLFICSVDAAK